MKLYSHSWHSRIVKQKRLNIAAIRASVEKLTRVADKMQAEILNYEIQLNKIKEWNS
jgi:hypothetical protein